MSLVEGVVAAETRDNFTRRSFGALTVLTTAGMVAAFIATLVTPRAFHLLFGCLLYLSVVLPAFLWGNKRLTAWNILVVASLPLVMLRSWYLFHYSTDAFRIAYQFRLPADLGASAAAAIELSIGTFLVGFGFYRSSNLSSPARFAVNWIHNPQIVRRMVIVFAAVAVVSFGFFIQLTGGFDASDLSSKRTLADAEVSTIARLVAYPAGFGLWAFLFFLEYVGAQNIVGNAKRLAVACFLGVLTVIPALYVS